MSFLEAIILGLVQGLTEFLPISSSVHLVMVQALIGIDTPDIIFEVFVHFGTLVAVVMVFWGDITKLCSAFFIWIKNISDTKAIFKSDEYFRLLVYILLGTLPAVLILIANKFIDIKSIIETFFSNPLLVSIMLLITGSLLFVTHWTKTGSRDLRPVDAIRIGLAQVVAIIPGISRSGSTISMAMFFGVEKYKAARFSFLLALPAILGATLLESMEILNHHYDTYQIWCTLIGTITAFISGYITLKLLISWIQKGKFSYFAFYCFVLGVSGIIYFI